MRSDFERSPKLFFRQCGVNVVVCFSADTTVSKYNRCARVLKSRCGRVIVQCDANCAVYFLLVARGPRVRRHLLRKRCEFDIEFFSTNRACVLLPYAARSAIDTYAPILRSRINTTIEPLTSERKSTAFYTSQTGAFWWFRLFFLSFSKLHLIAIPRSLLLHEDRAYTQLSQWDRLEKSTRG